MLLRSDPHAVRSIDRVGLLLATLATMLAFLLTWRSDPRRPVRMSASDGWWSGFDQGHYLSSALAFAHGSLSPAAHWYLPAYPVLASLFVRLVPGDPFMVPDLACLLASLWLSGGLGAELLPEWRWGRLAGLTSFLVCVVAPPVVLEAWVVPWTSTLAVPLMLGCLRATLAGMRQPHRRGPSALAGFAGAAVAGCRPVDAALMLACAGGLSGWVALRESGPAAAMRSWLLAFVLGGVAGLLPTLLLYLAIWGPHESPYMMSSALVGFEWRLLPLHWIELMISARPVVPEGLGLIQVLPFVGTGLLGLVAATVVPRADRLRHLLIMAAIISSMVFYLSYRDLHASGLWLFSNYHYFKWSFGLLGLYNVILVRMVVRRSGQDLLWLVPLGLLLFCWRVAPNRVAGSVGTTATSHSFSIPVPALGIDEAVIASAIGPFDPIYFGPHVLAIGGHPLLPIQDFKALPIFGGLMITPLRPWPAGLLTVRLIPSISLDREPAPFLARLDLHFGMPCWLGERQAGCDVNPLLAPRLVPEGRTLLFDGRETPMLGPGWSFAEPGGRWTSGFAAEFRFRIQQLPAQGIVLTLSASAIWRQGLRPLDVNIEVADHTLQSLKFNDGKTKDLSVSIPSSSIGPDGTVDVWLSVMNPYRPLDIFPPSHDVRPLGLYVRSIRWHAANAENGGQN